MKRICLSLWHPPVRLLTMVAGALLCSASPLMAAPPADNPREEGQAIDAREQLRQQMRERVLQQQNAPQANEHLPRPDSRLPGYPAGEQPCFTINQIALTGDEASRFQWALDAAADATGRCLGGQGIVLVINKVQNAILAKGYVTTRVMAQEQDLTKGVLTLTLQPGRISRIRFDEPVSWRGRLWNAIPASSGEILNLRDIEQGLENFKRVPSASADIKIVPGEQEATSDLQVNWREGRPVRLSLGLDDSGSRSTGRYLGSATLAVDAPFAQNDLFYANIGKNLFEHGPFGNRSHTLNYFFPIGYWAVSANYNDYTYHQNIPNANEVLRYSGKSDNFQLTVSRLLYRDQSNKTTLNLRGYRKHSTNAVNDIDIVQQKRRTAGWELGLNQHSYLGSSTLDASIAWRRGTGAFNALPAPEESRHQGSARTGILLGDLGINHPFAVGEQPWRVYSSVRGQWSPNALTPQERMAIAGRYTVRGFDGEQMLSGEKGLLWRNEIGWNLFSRGHELYLAADYGRVAGASGAVMGEYIAQQLYPGVKRSDLSEEQRQTISALGTLAAGLAGGVVGDSTADAVAGAQAGKTSLENNALSDIAQAQSEGKTPEQKAGEYVEAENERYKKANCGGMSAEACSVKMYEERREALKDMASLGADFVPVVGDIKSFAEAQSALDYLVTAIGIIPGAGDAAGKVIRAAETALKKGDVAEASKLINKASDEISAYSSATYPKLKEDLIQQNLNNIAKQDPRLAAVVKGDNGKLNYGVGTGTKEEADRLGKIWVGDGARPTSDGTGLVSADGTRIYRSPKEKPNAPDSLNPTGTQANFESYTKNIETGKMDKTGNGHLNISGENK